MSITSTLFLFLFFPVTLAGYYLIRSELRNCFLVAASLLFYTLGDPNYIWLLLCSILINYLLGLLMDRNLTRAEELKEYTTGVPYQRKAKFYLIISLVFNFGILFYYKYLAFSVDTVNSLLRLNFTLPVIGLPLGISFFTFRTVSYCLDIYWRTSQAQKNPIDMALYVSFFPQVTMGPITKYGEFVDQLNNRKFDIDAFSEGLKQIVIGLFKKMVIANTLGTVVDHIFSMSHSDRTAVLAWLGIIGYLLQLYHDFSGYSDMAVGLGKLFGFKTPKNFDYPYASRSVAEFWTRWHITLGTWLKDYIYTPVFRAMMEKKKYSLFVCNIVALLAVWLFSGLWHGAAWHFVVWGIYQFAFIALERAVENYQKNRRKRLKLKKQPETRRQAILRHSYLIFVVLFGQVMFRIDGFWNFFPYIGGMFGLLGNHLLSPFSMLLLRDNAILIIVATVLCFPTVPKIVSYIQMHNHLVKTGNILEPFVYIVVFLVVIGYMVNSSYDPFLYFNF